MTPEQVTNTRRDIRRAAALSGLSIRVERRRKRRSLARFLLALAPFVAFAAYTALTYGQALSDLLSIGGY